MAFEIRAIDLLCISTVELCSGVKCIHLPQPKDVSKSQLLVLVTMTLFRDWIFADGIKVRTKMRSTCVS